MRRVGYTEQTTDSFYFPAVLKGMWVTLKHLFKPWDHTTIEYPDEKWKPYPHYRGVHRLNKDEQGRIKCVACEMCQTACPAKCIYIEPEPADWDERERMPKRFEIDMLRCIYCGMCEEACPKEAIELTEIYDFSGTSRIEMIFDKEKLLQIYELTKDGFYEGEPGTYAKQSKSTQIPFLEYSDRLK